VQAYRLALRIEQREHNEIEANQAFQAAAQIGKQSRELAVRDDALRYFEERLIPNLNGVW
jgi:hypothetical protein